MSSIFNKQWILSVARVGGDPYVDLYFKPDMENGGEGIVRFEDSQLGITFEWYRDKSNLALEEHEFSFYYARQVYGDPNSFPAQDPNNPNPKEKRYLQIGKPYGVQGEPLLTVVNIEYSGGVVHIITAFQTENEYYTDMYDRSVRNHQKANAAFQRNVDYLASLMDKTF